MKLFRPALKNRTRGQTTLELLMVLMVLVPLFFGAIELARAVSLRHSLDAGAFTATRALSLDPTDLTYARGVVQDAVTENVFGGGAISSPNYGVFTLDPGCATPSFGCRFTFDAGISYTPWIPLLGGDPIVITIRHHGIIEKIN